MTIVIQKQELKGQNLSYKKWLELEILRTEDYKYIWKDQKKVHHTLAKQALCFIVTSTKSTKHVY